MKDIFLAYKVFFTCNNQDERNLHARTLANHIWEFIRKSAKQIDSPLDVFLDPFGNDEQVIKHLKNIRMYFRFVEAKLNIMAEIRHNASAHKDKDVSKQFDIIDNLKEDDFNITMVWLQCIAVSLVCFEKALYNKSLKVIGK